MLHASFTWKDKFWVRHNLQSQQSFFSIHQPQATIGADGS